MSADAESAGGAAGVAAGGVVTDATSVVEMPVVRIVTGSPTDVELAATQAVIAAVLTEQAAAGVPRLDPHVDNWHMSARQMRGHIAPGPGAWAASRGTRGC